jgi:hypothetical protein
MEMLFVCLMIRALSKLARNITILTSHLSTELREIRT